MAKLHDDDVETMMIGSWATWDPEPEFYHEPMLNDDTRMVQFEPPYYKDDVDEITKMVFECIGSVDSGKIDLIIRLSSESMVIVDGSTENGKKPSNLIFVYRNSSRIAEYQKVCAFESLRNAIAKSLGDDVIDA